MTTTAQVRVGQVWRDNDPRLQKCSRRIEVVEIDRDHAICKLAGVETKRRTRIRLNRFRPRSTGYVLEQDAP